MDQIVWEKNKLDNLSLHGIMKGNSFLPASRVAFSLLCGLLMVLSWWEFGFHGRKKKNNLQMWFICIDCIRHIGLFHHDFSPKKRGLKMWSWSWLRASKTTIGWPRIRKFCGSAAQGFQYKTMIFTDFPRSIFATKKNGSLLSMESWLEKGILIMVYLTIPI